LNGVPALAADQDWPGMMLAITAQRDREAFARIFDHFVPRIEAYLQRLGMDAVAAEEVAQDTLLTVWRKSDLFDPGKSSLSTWIYRIARNRRIDLARRDRLTFLDPMEQTFTSVIDESVGQDSQLQGAEQDDLVREAMKLLPEEQRVLLRLAFYEGRSHSEISDQTGLPLGTVKSRIRLAFARLRRELEKDGIDSFS
jgi:RNA polymerase sigma factor (sigma-70 family)